VGCDGEEGRRRRRRKRRRRRRRRRKLQKMRGGWEGVAGAKWRPFFLIVWTGAGAGASANAGWRSCCLR